HLGGWFAQTRPNDAQLPGERSLEGSQRTSVPRRTTTCKPQIRSTHRAERGHEIPARQVASEVAHEDLVVERDVGPRRPRLGDALLEEPSHLRRLLVRIGALPERRAE